jgi:hypothetical protein
MKLIKLFTAALVSSSILFSCSDNTAASANNNTAAASADNDGTFTGDYSLAYTIDGKHTAIKNILKKGGKNIAALFINEVTNDDAHGMIKLELTNELSAEFFEFHVANKGSTNILHYTPSFSDNQNKAVYLSQTGFRGISHPANFYADSVTVTISSVSASHVTGTFSGKFISDEQDKSQTVFISDGSFDVPIKPETNN